ncbi:hypothetical protein AAFF_G00084100 [Aldrovandia affinis]|uniref:PGC-1 and ERR-induced regulator in muscle protein 1 n=1 Tax=Aldrovandia affinis TaxID=143900 RepID=A0AAD7RX65_9TELE|nr:hypothetical protein AAFF_G00084100 [Aldrovandia affinis]
MGADALFHTQGRILEDICRASADILLDWHHCTLRSRSYAGTVADAGASRSHSFTMDDLDHSVYIAEQDWDSFFLESEECNLQQAALAGLDESGLSDFDEAEFCLSNQEEQVSPEVGPLGSCHSIDSPTDFKGLPVKPYLSVKGICGPEDTLSAGQDDEHQETVNVFFDRFTPTVDGEAEASLSDRASPVVSLYDSESSDLSLPETYDYFFSDYEVGKVFYPPIRRPSSHMNTAVPIFSCSRLVTQKLWFTEEYNNLFPEESPVESEDEDERTPIRVVTRFNNRVCEPLDISAGPDTYEHFFTDKDWRGNIFWRNPLSLRRVRFTGGLCGSYERSTSWASVATHWRRKSLFRTMNQGNTMDNRGSTPPLANIFYLQNQIGSELTDQQRGTELQAAIPIPRKEGFLFTLKQSDMCLVCIAFASWVLRSANPQSENSWKTALLANVSAISAIRYLRRYTSEDAPEDKR